MRKLSSVIVLASVCLFAAADHANACGDKLLRLARIHRYQQRTAQVTVLIYSRPTSLLQDASSLKLEKAFKDEGMHVIYAANENELALALQAGVADIVFADIADISGRGVNAPKQTLVIPVIAKNDKQNESKAKSFPALLKYPANAGRFLDAIDHALNSSAPERIATVQSDKSLR